MEERKRELDERKREIEERKRELEEYEDIIEDLTQTVRTVASKVFPSPFLRLSRLFFLARRDSNSNFACAALDNDGGEAVARTGIGAYARAQCRFDCAGAPGDGRGGLGLGGEVRGAKGLLRKAQGPTYTSLARDASLCLPSLLTPSALRPPTGSEGGASAEAVVAGSSTQDHREGAAERSGTCRLCLRHP